MRFGVALMFAALVRALVVLTVMAAAPAKADNYPSRNEIGRAHV